MKKVYFFGHVVFCHIVFILLLNDIKSKGDALHFCYFNQLTGRRKRNPKKYNFLEIVIGLPLGEVCGAADVGLTGHFQDKYL